MIDLGTVRPGSTVRIPFSSFDKDDGSSITMTNFAAADVLVYKDGSTTERASTSGFTATTDFDSKTGKHLIVLDLSDDTTSDFWKAGSEYLVAVDAVTVDAVTTGGWVARFRIGYDGALLDTSIATLASQTSFTLAVGPAEDSALVGREVVIHDKASAVQVATGVISAYTGSTKTVTLVAAPTFTIAAGDNVSVMRTMPLQPTVLGRTLDVSSGGEAGIDWANVGSPTTTLNLSGTTVKTATDVETDTADIQARLPAALVSGRMDASLGAIASGVDFSATMKASINTEADTALADVGLTTTITGRIDVAVSTRLATASYTAPLDAAGVRTAVGLASANLDTQLADVPTVAEFEARTILSADYATASSLSTVAGYIDTEVASILEDTGTTLPAQIAALNNLSSAGAQAAAEAALTAQGYTTARAPLLDRLDALISSRAATGAAMTLTSGERDAIAAALLDLTNGIESGLTPRNALKLALAVLAGKVTGGGTGTELFKSADVSGGAVQGTTTRLTVTDDSSGNRSAITVSFA